MRFGVFLSPDAARPGAIVEQARSAEHHGLDLIGVQDHPYQPTFLDTFTLIGHLLARTERITVFPDVANLPLRTPAMLAKAAASLDLLSGGRFELGIGTGGLRDAVAAMGGPRRTPGESIDALEEAIAILRQAWAAAGPLWHGGAHYRLEGYQPGPAPAHRIGIWVGAYRPRMLALTGRLADGWVPSMAYLPPDAAADARRRVDEAARRAGRDPAEIARIYNLNGTIQDRPGRAGTLTGPPDAWAETLARLAGDLGFDTFVLAPSPPEQQQIERYATEVVPQVRAALRRHTHGT